MALFSSSTGPRGLFCQTICWAVALGGILCFCNNAFAQSSPPAWRDHLTRQDVINALGEPLGDIQNGATERMVYKNGLLIVLNNSLVTSIEGQVPDALKTPAAAPAATVASAPAASAATSAPTPVAQPAPTVTPASTSAAASSTTSSPAAEPAADTGAQGDKDSEKIINDFSSTSIVPQGTTYSAAIAKALGPGQNGMLDAAGSANAGSPWKDASTWQGFLAGWLLKTILMTAVLKGTFAYKDFPVLWREAAFVAAGVSFCNQALAWLFSLNDFGKIASMVQADQLVAGAVLLTLIMNFTAAKQFSTAAAIMMTAMAANIAMGYAQLFFF